MDATLASINVEDPTRAGAEDEIDAPGVTDQAVEKALRDRAKKEKKSKKSKGEDVVMADADDSAAVKAAKKAEKKRRQAEAATAEDVEMAVDEEALRKKLKKEKKEKRKSEGLVAGEVPVEQIGGKKKKSKA